MIARNWIGSALVLALLLLPGLFGCRSEVSNSAIEDKKLDDLTKSVNKLSDEMVTRHDLDEASKGWAKKNDVDRALAAFYGQSVSFGELAQKVDQQNEQLAKLKTELGAANARLAKAASSAALAASFEARLRKAEDKLEANVQVTAGQQKDIGAIVERDGAGNAIVSIGQVRKNPQFTAAVDEEVTKALSKQPPFGMVRIDNRNTEGRYIEVNGGSYWVPPGRYIDVDVRVGWVTTRLTGYERAKTWRLGKPDYFETLIINPQPIDSSAVWYPYP
jgi:hypothetical protein